MNKNNTIGIILTGLISALVFIATRSIQIPVPGTLGYIHAGDSIIFLAPIFLGWKRGAIAASIGAGLADFLSPYAIYTVPTLIIKAVMVLIVGMVIEKTVIKQTSLTVNYIIGMILAGAWMVFGYGVTEFIITGTIEQAFLTIPMNVVQFIESSIIAMILYTALSKTTIKQYFEYK